MRAADVRHGFIAFSYAGDFQSVLDDRSIEHLRRGGSSNNIRNDAIRFLARYMKDRLRRPEGLQALELQFLALGTYVETMRQLDRDAAGAARSARPSRTSTGFAPTSTAISRTSSPAPTFRARSICRCASIYDSVKARTGRSPYNLIIEKRVERACAMLRDTNASIAEVACACGFSSQQHLTATLSRRLGRTPRRLRGS